VNKWVAVIPQDTVHVRDGRSFDAGVDAAAASVMPTPATLGGAIGAAYGARLLALRGPVLGERASISWSTWFPAPQDLAVDAADSTTVHRLEVIQRRCATDLDYGTGWVGPVSGVDISGPVEDYLPGGTLAEYLADWSAGDVRPARDLDLRDRDSLLVPERRVGLARTAGGVARSGFLYQTTHIRPRDGVGFLMDCDFPDTDRTLAAVTRLGGVTRLADVEPVVGRHWPDRPDRFPGGRVLVYLATPAIWSTGSRFPCPDDARVVTAALGRPQAVASASPGSSFMTSRTLRWAVPAGSVYYLRFDTEDAALRWAADSHGTACGPTPDPLLRTAGYGVVLAGTWS